MDKRELNKYGIETNGAIYRNDPPGSLVEKALLKGEGRLSRAGALCINTGKRTGRSPDDKYIVDTPAVHDKIAWGKVNKPVSKEKFDMVYDAIVKHFKDKDLYIFDGFAGANPKYSYAFRIINEKASQNLFISNLLIKPTPRELQHFQEDFVILVAPECKIDKSVGLNSDVAVMIDYERQIVLIAGTGYSGEIKKSVFCVMNYMLPQRNVFTMHCSANIGDDGNTALFFGLSGTGKTTLSADPSRKLIGDDEHGWSRTSVFNFEGGCYAKCIGLSKKNEPEIWDAVRFGAVAENVQLFEDTRIIDFNDDSITENTRVGYPLNYIANIEPSGVAPIPKTIFFLAADAFGVLPPISKLDKNSAAYHFVSGYTSKLAGTEDGITEPQATFSTCFGEPFLPLDPLLYAKQFQRRVEKAGASVFLINTGWVGGSYGVGKRIPLKYTRRMINAAINGELDYVGYETDPFFNLNMPKFCPGVPSELLNPKSTWLDKSAYDKTAEKLVDMFVENFKQYTNFPDAVVNAGPGKK
jgi:phosphoenolpyruvate carboxykinase (ATP)